MTNEIYKSTINTKENLDGYEDTQQIVFFPTEKRSSRIKNTKVVVTNVVSSVGFHLDRENLDGVFDNPLIELDAEPEDSGQGSVLCPDNTLLETFTVTDDINTGLTTSTLSMNLVSFESVEQLISTEIVKDLNRYLKSIEIETDNNSLDYYIDYGEGFVLTENKIYIPNNISHEAIYMIKNNTASTQELTSVTVKYEFW